MEIQLPMMKFMDQLRGEILNTVTKDDFRELKQVVSDLSHCVSDLSVSQLEIIEIQKRTETRVEELTQAQRKTEKRVDTLSLRMEELAEAQKRTETRVEELTQAQWKTEKRVDTLSLRMEELAEAQKRTETRVEELVEAQRKTEKRVDTLSDTQEELAEAQKRTETRVEELAEAQKRTETRVEELAEAQKRTENILQGVIKRQDKMSKEIGGLSNTVGYMLENEAIRYLPDILQKEKGIHIRVIDRRFIVYPNGKDDEINIYAEGIQDGEKIFIIGESKAQMGKKDVSRFEKLLARVSKHLSSEVWPLFITHSAHPDVETYAKNRIPGLSIYKSYDLKPMNGK